MDKEELFTIGFINIGTCKKRTLIFTINGANFGEIMYNLVRY